MRHHLPLVIAAIAACALTGCAPLASAPTGSERHDETHTRHDETHTMDDGSVMSGADHAATAGPSPAAQMICDGQVVEAVATIVGNHSPLIPAARWAEPVFSCTFDIDGRPLVLSVHDATDVAVGEDHFASLLTTYVDAENIDGMLGLGLPSFATPNGVVAFLRDGKSLVVDASALSPELGPNGTRTREQVAYALASSVLVCWVQHD